MNKIHPFHNILLNSTWYQRTCCLEQNIDLPHRLATGIPLLYCFATTDFLFCSAIHLLSPISHNLSISLFCLTIILKLQNLARWLIIFTVIAATSVAEGHAPLERSNVSPLSLPFDPSPATLYSSSDLLLLLIITPHYRCSSSFGGYNPLVMTRPPLSSSITSRRSRLHGRRLSAPNSLLLVPVGETRRHHPTLLGRHVRQRCREEAGCTVGGRALQIPPRLDSSLGQIWVFPSSSYAWLVTSAATNPQPYAPVPATSSLDIR